MTDTNHLAVASSAKKEKIIMPQREYEVDEPEPLFFVERDTRFIYEVKLFPEFALVRPAHPDFASAVERIPLVKLATSFDEYWGDPQAVKDFLWGGGDETVEVERK